jgi:CTP:molybdopterin cytidylyltransferase MocA
MTVAAVILAESIESALADAGGRAAVRRVVESAWSGGAVPIVVVAPDSDGQVAAALSGSGAVLAEPAPPERGAAGQVARGIEVARDGVGETDAAIIWPARMVWADAETVTSLIQAHGTDEGSILRPTWRDQQGWPVLVPVIHAALLASVTPGPSLEDVLDDVLRLGAPLRLIDLGDPGVTHDRSTPREAIPDYEGPPRPLAAPPEWGAEAAEREDDAPLEGPALAPYGQAADPDE